MRYASLLVVGSISLVFAACGGGGDDDGSGPDGGGGADSSGSGGGTNSGGGTGSGSAPGSGDMVFTDLPGKIRFVNFVSDGTAGVNLDLYWGVSIEDSELIATVDYGEITEFLVPRRADFALLDEDEARYFAVPEGVTEVLADRFLVNDDQVFDADTVITVALSGVENIIGDDLVVGRTNIYEHNLVAAPVDMAQVFSWSAPFDQIDDGDFVLVGADDLCHPEEVGSIINLGQAFLIPEGTTGLTVFDANTECASGVEPITETVEPGHSYVLMGKAETFELEARSLVLLEIGLEN